MGCSKAGSASLNEFYQTSRFTETHFKKRNSLCFPVIWKTKIRNWISPSVKTSEIPLWLNIRTFIQRGIKEVDMYVCVK